MTDKLYPQALLIDSAILHVEEFLIGRAPKYYVEETITESLEDGGTKVTRRFKQVSGDSAHSHVSYLTYPKPIIEFHYDEVVFHGTNNDLGGPIPQGVFERIKEEYRKAPDATAVRLTYSAIGFTKEDLQEPEEWNFKSLLTSLKNRLIAAQK